MANTHHCLVEKAFDSYTPGAVAQLSENGFARMRSGRFGAYIRELAVERDNGDVVDPSGKVVIAAKDRTGPLDLTALAQGRIAQRGAPSDRLATTARARA